jgi:SAM-dependent methyltransferase
MVGLLRSPGHYAKQLFHDLRLEGSGPGKEAAAMGVGAFIGCLPVYGGHLLLVIAVGRLLGLNRLRMYIAANISNPFFAPLLILAEIQAGALIQRGETHDLTLAAIRATDPWTFGTDLVIGSVVLGTAIGLAMAGLTWASVASAPPLVPHLARVFDLAAYRFLEVGVTAWEFARAKLRRDPIYTTALALLPQSGTTLVDVGCGQGLTLAVLIEAAAAVSRGEWPPGTPPPPRFDRLVGIETRARVAAMARRALPDGAEIIHDAAPGGLPAQLTAALVFDVLHLMSAPDQERLVMELRARLEPGGVVLVRDVDAAAGPGFHAVRIGNRLKNLAVGQYGQTFHFRTAAEWTGLFTRAGWTVEQSPMGHGTPFANVLFKLT